MKVILEELSLENSNGSGKNTHLFTDKTTSDTCIMLSGKGICKSNSASGVLSVAVESGLAMDEQMNVLKGYDNEKREEDDATLGNRQKENDVKDEALQRARNIAAIKLQLTEQAYQCAYLQEQIIQRNTELKRLHKALVGEQQALVKLADSRVKWGAESFVCPTCKRVHEPTNVEAMKQKMVKVFEKDKTDKRRIIKKKIKALRYAIKQLEQVNAEDAQHLRIYKSNRSILSAALKTLEVVKGNRVSEVGFGSSDIGFRMSDYRY